MGERNAREPFAPPEDWHEPTGATNYRIIVQEPGPGYRHVVTPDQIRNAMRKQIDPAKISIFRAGTLPK